MDTVLFLMLGIVVPKPSRIVSAMEKSNTMQTFALIEESLRTLLVLITFRFLELFSLFCIFSLLFTDDSPFKLAFT